MSEYQRDQIESLTDKELIAELQRRGRLLVVEANGMYYTDLKDDDNYMRHCDEGIMRLITRTLRDKLIPKIIDRTAADNENLMIRNGSVVVLLSREQAELERHEAAKSSAAMPGVSATA